MLADLNALAETGKRNIEENVMFSEISLGTTFKKLYSEKIGTNKTINFFKATAQYKNEKGQIISLANSWFVISYYLVDYYKELMVYKNEFENIFSSDNKEEIAKKLFSIDSIDSIEEDINLKIDKKFTEIQDQQRFKSFLINKYNWWSGQKKIDRQDFYISALLQIANVINDSSSFIATIAKKLAEDTELYEAFNFSLISSNNFNSPTIADYSIINNYYLSIKTKPFIILAGLSGTGKSRLVRSLAYQFNNILEDKVSNKYPPTNFKLIKVKPNWHDSSELLGYESRISGKDRYIVTDFMRFIVAAWKHPATPFFICLDEMNLAPVEQYFAEYLSVIETREIKEEGQIITDCLISNNLIKKYADKTSGADTEFDLWNELNITEDHLKLTIKDKGICLPSNLIVIGTVNMDETTHSFSRKVLDRAMTIEMNDINFSEGLLDNENKWEYYEEALSAQLVLSEKTHGYQVYEVLGEEGPKIIKYLESVNEVLENSPFKIAYRVRDEFLLYAYNYSLIDNKPETWFADVLDQMTLMKILPRIEGDDHKTSVLTELIDLFNSVNLQSSSKKAHEMNKRRTEYHYTSFWI